MLYIHKPFFRSFQRQKSRPSKLPVLSRLLPVILLVITGGAAWSELALSAVSEELIQEAARGYVLDSIAQAVDAELAEETEPFVEAQRNADGQVEIMNADWERLNRVRAGVLERLAKSLRGKATVHVPIGSLTGIGLLSGRGFPVPIALQMEGSAVAEFSTDLLSAGVNQTCHRLVLTVRANACSQSKRFGASVEAESATVLAETVVVGEVPKLMTGRA